MQHVAGIVLTTCSDVAYHSNMQSNVDKDTRDGRKVVKLDEPTWALMSHESIDRRCSFQNLLTTCCRLFLALPESRREKLVRDAETTARAARTDAA